jgi:hypothetical protein
MTYLYPFALIVLTLATSPGTARRASEPDTWTSAFHVEPGELGPTGRNPWFVLEPGYRLVLEGGAERLVITVLDETRTVDGVTTRAVEERETKDGKVVEVSKNWFAISRRTNSVFYFGEDVDIVRDGRVVDHEGAWRSGVQGARYGLMMPGIPLLGAKFFQEHAPKVAMDRARIAALNTRVSTPAGEFGCLEIEETNPLEPGDRESKFYAAGIGLVQDGSLKLVSHGPKK